MGGTKRIVYTSLTITTLCCCCCFIDHVVSSSSQEVVDDVKRCRDLGFASRDLSCDSCDLLSNKIDDSELEEECRSCCRSNGNGKHSVWSLFARSIHDANLSLKKSSFFNHNYTHRICTAVQYSRYVDEN